VTSRAEQFVWERGWKGHEMLQLRRLADLSLVERLKWLEDAHDLVRRLAASGKDGIRGGDS